MVVATSAPALPSMPLRPILSLFLLPLLLFSSLHAYPAFYMIRNLPQIQHNQPGTQEDTLLRPAKRAFDRLDVSPFDFDAMTKRFSDDDMLAPYDGLYEIPASPQFGEAAPRKRAFDRLEDSGFFGQKRKRAFDRLDSSLMLAKRRA